MSITAERGRHKLDQRCCENLPKKELAMVERGWAGAVLLAFQDSRDAVLQKLETLSSIDCRSNAAPPGRQVTSSTAGEYVGAMVG